SRPQPGGREVPMCCRTIGRSVKTNPQANRARCAMTVAPTSHPAATRDGSGTMRAAVFERPGVITLQERAMPACGPTDAIVRVTMTTICGTDVHILKGEYPVAPGRIVGHEPVGVIHELGS